MSDRVHLAGQYDSAPRYPLRGRSELDARIDGLVQLAVSEGSGVILLRGESGIGKTRLLAAALDRARDADWATVVVTPDVDSSNLPLSALLDGAEDAVPPLLHGDVVSEALRGADPHYWITRMMTEALERHSLRSPVLVVVDDMQWLDASSLTVLSSLMRSVEGEQIAWLLATRTGTYRREHGRLIDTIASTGDVIDVQRLTHDDAVEITTDLLGSRPGSALETSLALTSYIPLLVVELIRGLREEGLLETADFRVEAVGGAIPARFGASFRDRLSHLSPVSLRLIQVGSLIGRRFRLVDVLTVLALPAVSSAAAVEELIAQEVLADDGEYMAFLHDSLREGAEATLTPSLRKVLAREVAQVRLASGESVSGVASALIEAAEPGDEQSFLLLREAAIELASFDAGEASRLAAAALRVAAGAPRFAQRASDLIPVLWAGGKGQHAREATSILAPHLAAEDRARTLLAVSRHLTEASFDEAMSVVDDALSLSGVSRSTRAELLAVRSLNAANKADASELQRSLVEARAVADPHADSRALATIDATESVFEFYNHRWDSSLTLIARAFDNARRVGMHPNLWLPEGLWPAFARNSIGEPEIALKLVDAGMQEASAANSATAEAFWMMVRCRILFDAGRLDDARLHAETVLDLAGELGLGDFAHATAGIVLFKVALHMGDSTLAELMRPMIRTLADGVSVARAGRWALAVEAHDDGRLEDAYELSSGAVSSLLEPIPSMSQPVDFADDLTLLEIVLAAGDESAVEKLDVVASQRADANPSSPLAAAVRDALRGRIREDPSLIRAAAELLRSVARPLVRARVLEMHRFVRADPQETRIALEEALRIYEAHGASRDVSRVLAALRSLGVRRRPTQSRRSDLLSARETQVLEHLVRGATTQQIANALFVSPHTVVSNVRHIYAKLGVNSRKELVARHAQR